MIIYKDSVANFHRDVFQGVIANKLEELFLEHNIGKESRGEYRSWNNSLEVVSSTLKYSNVNEDLKVAIEYQGGQHYESVELYGGKKAFKGIQERDTNKKELCNKQGIKLVEWKYDVPITKDNLDTLLANK